MAFTLSRLPSAISISSPAAPGTTTLTEQPLPALLALIS